MRALPIGGGSMPGATACKAPRCGSAAGAPPPCPSSCPPGEATSCKLDAPVTPPSPKETLSPAQPIRLIPTADTLELATNRRPAQREQMPHRTCFLPPTLALTPPNSLPITGSGTTLAFQRQALDLVAAAAVGGAMGCIAGSTAKSAADVAQLLYTHLTFTLLLRKLGLIHIEWHRVCRPCCVPSALARLPREPSNTGARPPFLCYPPAPPAAAPLPGRAKAEEGGGGPQSALPAGCGRRGLRRLVVVAQ